MSFITGNRVRLIKAVPVRNVPGPAIDAVGTVMAPELPATPTLSTIWRVEFDDFCEQFYSASPPGIWFVGSDEIELLATNRSKDCGNRDSEARAAQAAPQKQVGSCVS